MKNLFNTSMDVKHRQIGLSLIELMISITIGLIVLAALTTLFSKQSQTRSELDKANRMIDNGRYALELISDNLRVSGFYDRYHPASGTPTSTPDPCDTSLLTASASNLDVLRHHIQGYNAAASSTQITPLPTACSFNYSSTANNLTLKAGSDILVIRRASTATPVTTGSANASTIYLQASNCSNDPTEYIVALGNSGSFTLRKKDCSTVESLRPLMVQIYYISPNNESGDGIPTLKRIELDTTSGTFTNSSNSPPIPLVEGIEYMQIDYGEDTNSDGAPDGYIAAPTTAQWPNIVSIKVSVLARNIEATTGYADSKTYTLNSVSYGPFNDSYKRHVYTQVVRLVNPSGRRE